MTTPKPRGRPKGPQPRMRPILPRTTVAPETLALIRSEKRPAGRVIDDMAEAYRRTKR